MEVNYRRLKAVRKEWEKLYKCTPEVSPFLQYDAFEIAWKYFYPYYITGLCRPKVAQFVDGGQTVALIPLIIRGKTAQLFGHPNGFNESGTLYVNQDILPFCFRLLHERFSSVELIKIDERSPLSKFRPKVCVGISNVAINFGDDYDSYFKSLTSSVRQNIRTSFNRLEKDGHTYELDVYTNHGLDESRAVGGG